METQKKFFATPPPIRYKCLISNNFSTQSSSIFHSLLNHEQTMQSGRSMVEMLGVLAVVGLLSIIGLAGIRSALDSHKANTIVQAVNRRATILAADKNFGTGFTDNALFGQDTDYTITCADIENTNLFSCTVQSVAQEVCEKVKKSDWKTPTTMLPTTCGTTNDMVFTFSKDLDGSGTLCSEETPCPNPQATCTNGVCVEPPLKSCDTNAENPCGDECQTCNPTTLLCENACTRKQYLESTGTQYIDTEIQCKKAIKTECSFQMTSIATTQLVYGSYTSGANHQMIVYSDRFVPSLGNGNVPIYPSDLNKHIVVIDGNDLSCTFDGLPIELSSTSFGTNNNNIFLFARSGTSALNSLCKIYYIKIYDNNGTLVRDYIPVLDFNNTPAMYDKVEKKLYHNKGTGNFITD